MNFSKLFTADVTVSFRGGENQSQDIGVSVFQTYFQLEHKATTYYFISEYFTLHEVSYFYKLTGPLT